LVYAGTNQKSKKWQVGTTSNGGKILENITQAIARDVLACDMLALEETGAQICGHVHDEAIVESHDTPFSIGADEMQEIMSRPIEWLPGFLSAADSFETKYYRK
ncbi:MAG TPA: hypothetical protein VGG71_08560, partial [Chitinophagaceae bacterium]